MKKQVLISAIMGMGFGFPVTLLCMFLFGSDHADLWRLLVWMVASALYGVFSAWISGQKTDLPLLGMVGLHAGGCTVITLAAVLICGYVRSVLDVVPVLLAAVAIYVVIYGICVWFMKCNERKINQALRKK